MTRPPDHILELDAPADLDLDLLARGSHLTLPSPAHRSEPGLLRAATAVTGSPHQVAVRWEPGPAETERRVEAGIWGPDAVALARRVPDLLGISDATRSEFHPEDRQLRRWWRRTPGVPLPKALSVLESLVPIVLGQKIHGKEAVAIQTRLYRRFAEEAPGPVALPVPLSPAQLREIGWERWHTLGLERRRARLIHRLAERAEELESWRDLGTEDLYARLTAIPGIGPWSANRLLYALGHADAVWIGDYNLPSFVAWNLAAEPRADDRRLLELLEPYRGHRARVLRLIELHGSRPPRYGPRLPFRNIQRR